MFAAFSIWERIKTHLSRQRHNSLRNSPAKSFFGKKMEVLHAIGLFLQKSHSCQCLCHIIFHGIMAFHSPAQLLCVTLVLTQTKICVDYTFPCFCSSLICFWGAHTGELQGRVYPKQTNLGCSYTGILISSNWAKNITNNTLIKLVTDSPSNTAQDIGAM